MAHKFKLTLLVEVSGFIFDGEGHKVAGPEPTVSDIKDNLEYNVLSVGGHGLSEAMEREVSLKYVMVEPLREFCAHPGIFRGETCPKCKADVK